MSELARRCRYCDARARYESVEAAIADEGWTHDEHGFVVCDACAQLGEDALRARRLIGDAEPAPVLPGQLDLLEGA